MHDAQNQLVEFVTVRAGVLASPVAGEAPPPGRLLPYGIDEALLQELDKIFPLSDVLRDELNREPFMAMNVKLAAHEARNRLVESINERLPAGSPEVQATEDRYLETSGGVHESVGWVFQVIENRPVPWAIELPEPPGTTSYFALVAGVREK